MRHCADQIHFMTMPDGSRAPYEVPYMLWCVWLFSLLTVALTSESRCSTSFHKYTSSQLEQKWINNVEKWQVDLCNHISNDEMNWWIRNTSSLLKDTQKSIAITKSAEPPTNKWTYVFPVFTYKKICTQKKTNVSRTEFVHMSIEPTAAIARDPRKVYTSSPPPVVLKLTHLFIILSLLCSVGSP